MKTVILIASLALAGCGDFNSMSEGEAKAFNACLEKGMKATFKATISSRVVSCKRK